MVDMLVLDTHDFYLLVIGFDWLDKIANGIDALFSGGAVFDLASSLSSLQIFFGLVQTYFINQIEF